ncbi:HD domain-containing protein [bacterium]|nr:HD domain-containing protein [bacterium]
MSQNTKNFNPVDYRDPKGEYVPVSIEGLQPAFVRDIELYVRAGTAFFLVKPKNMELSSSLMSRFWGKFPYLYIHKSSKDKYYSHLENNVSRIIKSTQHNDRQKASVLTDYAVEIVDQMMRDPSSKVAIASAQNFAQECVNFIASSRHAFIHLVELSSHDHYTYAHSVGVSAYGVALAQSLGLWSKAEISDIGVAGLLHDIGKSLVDPAILNKAGPLNDDEWQRMKKHPSDGAALLRDHKNLKDIIPLCAEAHHEDLRGLGYPKGIIASKLDSSVQIITIADAFSALTTNRSYSKGKDALTALKLMKENIDKKFDPHFFERFVVLFLDPAKRDSGGELTEKNSEDGSEESTDEAA